MSDGRLTARIREDLSQLFPSHRHARNEIVSYLRLEAKFADSRSDVCSLIGDLA